VHTAYLAWGPEDPQLYWHIRKEPYWYIRKEPY
jgi:hypothetical protein